MKQSDIAFSRMKATRRAYDQKAVAFYKADRILQLAKFNAEGSENSVAMLLLNEAKKQRKAAKTAYKKAAKAERKAYAFWQFASKI
jgi:hypothetical protein